MHTRPSVLLWRRPLPGEAPPGLRPGERSPPPARPGGDCGPGGTSSCSAALSEKEGGRGGRLRPAAASCWCSGSAPPAPPRARLTAGSPSSVSAVATAVVRVAAWMACSSAAASSWPANGDASMLKRGASGCGWGAASAAGGGATGGGRGGAEGGVRAWSHPETSGGVPFGPGREAWQRVATKMPHSHVSAGRAFQLCANSPELIVLAERQGRSRAEQRASARRAGGALAGSLHVCSTGAGSRSKIQHSRSREHTRSRPASAPFGRKGACPAWLTWRSAPRAARMPCTMPVGRPTFRSLS